MIDWRARVRPDVSRLARGSVVWMIARASAAFLAGILSQWLMASPAFAIDCTRAVSPVDRKICASPNLVAADAAMGRAYAELVRSAPDREVRDMLVNSQRRWVRARNDWIGKRGATVDAIHDAIVDRSNKLSDRGGTGFIISAQRQRKQFARYGGGAFSGFNTDCEFIPDTPKLEHYRYMCTGIVQAQNNGRICSLETDWATWQFYTYLAVSEIRDGKAVLTATCDTRNSCEPSQGSDWKRGAETEAHDLFPLASGLPKLDPEALIVLEDSDGFFDQCLKTPRYPAGS